MNLKKKLPLKGLIGYRCYMKKKLFYVFGSLILVLLILNIVAMLVIRNFYQDNIPVLAYHIISDNPKDDMEVSTTNFRMQMKYLHDHHFQVLSIDDVIAFKKGEKNFPGKKVAITFDDGSESYYLKALPIMKEYDFPSTNFVITSKINNRGYLSAEQIDKLKEEKLVKLESHSYGLHNREFANSRDYDKYNDDLKKNSQYHFKYYAYPFGISNEEYIKALKENGIEYAFKYAPSHWLNRDEDDYSLSRVPIYNSISYNKFILKLLIKR